MKIYKTYFDKSDTPYKQEFQSSKKNHTVWKRQPYKMFLLHAVVKIKLFGLFTIYEPNEDELFLIRNKIKQRKEENNEQV